MRQPVERGLQCAQAPLRPQLNGRVSRFRRHVVFLFQSNKRHLAAAQTVRRGIRRDAEKPRPELRLGTPIRQGLPRSHERLLRELQRLVVRADHAQDEAVHPVLVAAHQRAERVAIALTAQRHTFAVGELALRRAGRPGHLFVIH